MAFSRKSGGTNVTLTTYKRRSAGTNVTLTVAKRRLSGAWVNIIPFTVTAPDITASAPSGTSVSGSSSSTVAFGVGPFTYSWVKTTGLAATTLTNATTSTVTATKNTTSIGTQAGTVTLTVTDTGNGGATTSCVINILLENT